jgi:hypothetical protein
MALTARVLISVTKLPFALKVTLMLQLTVKFKTVTWDNTNCDTVENYHVDGGSVSFTVISHTLNIRAQTSGCSGDLKV